MLLGWIGFAPRAEETRADGAEALETRSWLRKKICGTAASVGGADTK